MPATAWGKDAQEERGTVGRARLARPLREPRLLIPATDSGAQRPFVGMGERVNSTTARGLLPGSAFGNTRLSARAMGP